MRRALRGRERDYLIKISLILPKNGLILEGQTLFPEFLPKNPTFCLRHSRDVVKMREGRGYIYIQGSRSIILCDTWHSYLPPTPSTGLTFFGLEFSTAFYPAFRGSFWRPFGTHNGSCVVPLEILRRLLSNDIKFAYIGARTENLWLPEVWASK